MIRARGLTRRFGGFTAVDGVSLDVPNGAILALLGPNGAGKTTTVRMLAGLIAPSEGEASVAGYDVRRDASAVRARVGLVTDSPGLHEQMTLPAYLDFFGAIYGVPRAERSRRIDELTAFFDLRDHQRERMAGFSKGMKQKVALARALLHDPVALFLDEPTSGLDPLAARAVRELIVGLKRASRVIILCTHDLDEAERLADEIAIMRTGAIVRRGAPAILRASSSPETAVRIRLAAPLLDADRAMAGLALLNLQADYTRSATELTYVTPDPESVNPQVIARLVEMGARIVAVDCATRALEDIYAEAVGSQTNDGAHQSLASIVE
jgi:ABC-2 type transport system ATP-binding protein